MSDSDSDFEGANEYTGLMDGHIAGEVVMESINDRPGGKKKIQKPQQNDGLESQVICLVVFLAIYYLAYYFMLFKIYYTNYLLVN